MKMPKPETMETEKPARFRLIKREVDQVVFNISKNVAPIIDLNCTGLCAETLKQLVPEQEDKDADLSDEYLSNINASLQPILKNMSSEKRNVEVHLEAMATNGTTDSASWNSVTTVNGTSTFANRSAAINGTKETDTSYEDLLAAAQGSFAAGSVFAMSWVASIYGLISMAVEIKELLIAPILIFVSASLVCIGIIFVDMGVFETSGVFKAIYFFLLFLGAVVKIFVAAVFLFCFFVVFSYYKELQNCESTSQIPSEPISPRPARTQSNSAQTPPGPPQTPLRPAPSPPPKE